MNQSTGVQGSVRMKTEYANHFIPQIEQGPHIQKRASIPTNYQMNDGDGTRAISQSIKPRGITPNHSQKQMRNQRSTYFFDRRHLELAEQALAVNPQQ